MRILLVVPIFVLLPTYGNCLQCQKCNGCEISQPLQETCRNIDTTLENVACMTQVIRDLHSRDPRMTIKKCVTFDRTQRFNCPDLPFSDPISCTLCYNDMCNAATSVAAILTTIITGVVLVSFF